MPDVRLPADDPDVSAWLTRYPPADISPAEFEDWVGEVLGGAASEVEPA